jgi:hypothetical protein
VPTILLVADDVGQVLDRLGLPAALVQHLPPRIGVVEVDDDAVAGLRRAAGVLGIGDPDLPDDVRAGLTETERLFADAWAAGREPKTRPGEGLAWDAPGFQPPDLPR